MQGSLGRGWRRWESISWITLGCKRTALRSPRIFSNFSGGHTAFASAGRSSAWNSLAPVLTTKPDRRGRGGGGKTARRDLCKASGNRRLYRDSTQGRE